MKILKSFLLIAAIAFSSVLSASTNPNEAKTSKTAESTVITSQVSKLLQNPTFLVDEDIFANVTLTINKHNEIVVLSVDSDDNMLEGYIKGRLNYQSLPKAIKNGERTFVVPVKIQTELN